MTFPQQQELQKDQRRIRYKSKSDGYIKADIFQYFACLTLLPLVITLCSIFYLFYVINFIWIC